MSLRPFYAPLTCITINFPSLSAFNGKYEDIHQLITNLVVAFTFATVVVVVALPLFGYKVSLVTEALESNSPVDDNSLRIDPTAEAFTNYGAPPAYEGYARSLASSLVSRFSKTSTSHGSPKTTRS